MKIIYLVSTHNSGSTPIALLANAHPAMISPGEMIGPGGRFHGTEGPICSCGETIAKCLFWQKVGIQFQAKGFSWQPDKWGLDFSFSEHPVLTRFILNRPDTLSWRIPLFSHILWFSTKIQELLDRNDSFAETLLEVSGREVILDASKHLKRLYHLSRSSQIDLHTIHLIRDPRGWCNSRRKNFNEPVFTSAKHWVLENQRIARLTHTFPKRKKIIIRYEEFCTNPQASMNRIWNFAGLPDFSIQEDINLLEHHLLGNRMRTNKNIVIKEDLSWKCELSSHELVTIENITRLAANKFGYNIP